MAQWKRLRQAAGGSRIDVNMEHVACIRLAPNSLMEIVFSTGDGVQVCETADEIHQATPVPQPPG